MCESEGLLMESRFQKSYIGESRHRVQTRANKEGHLSCLLAAALNVVGSERRWPEELLLENQ